MFAIYKKEMRSYFINAIGYVYIAIFIAVAAFICCLTTILGDSSGRTADVTLYFWIMPFVFIVMVPLLTMKMFSEERKLRTEQLLLTSPVSISRMVFAKYLASFTMFAGTLLLSCISFYPLYKFGTPATSTLIGNLIGVVCIGSAFLAIGLFISSLTENQLVAAVITVGAILFLLVIGFINSFIESYVIRSVISWISIFNRYQNFTYGYFDFAALLYYISICAVFIFFTIRVYERRRWN